MSKSDRASAGRWVDFGEGVRALVDLDYAGGRDVAVIFEKSLVALEIDGDYCAELTPEVKLRLLQTNWKCIAEFILTAWLTIASVAQTIVATCDNAREARHN